MTNSTVLVGEFVKHDFAEEMRLSTVTSSILNQGTALTPMVASTMRAESILSA
jgi:hypothetical protein